MAVLLEASCGTIIEEPRTNGKADIKPTILLEHHSPYCGQSIVNEMYCEMCCLCVMGMRYAEALNTLVEKQEVRTTCA